MNILIIIIVDTIVLFTTSVLAMWFVNIFPYSSCEMHIKLLHAQGINMNLSCITGAQHMNYEFDIV